MIVQVEDSEYGSCTHHIHLPTAQSRVLVLACGGEGGDGVRYRFGI